MSERQQDEEAGALVIEILSGRHWTDHASTMHAEVISALESSGFDVYPEWRVRLKNGRGGRIDIVAEYGGGGWVGLELDCRRPRFKSVAKLHLFNGYRIIGLRGIDGHKEPQIDVCIGLRVNAATKIQKADRRIYRAPPEWADDWRDSP